MALQLFIFTDQVLLVLLLLVLLPVEADSNSNMRFALLLLALCVLLLLYYNTRSVPSCTWLEPTAAVTAGAAVRTSALQH